MNRRNPSLDVLRALAALEIIGYHLEIPAFQPLAALGVDLFLVLSGFLISGLMFGDYRKYGTIRLGRFWLRRAFKILPPVYVFILVMFVFLRGVAPASSVVHAVLFSANFLSCTGVLVHLWTLSLEEQFYIFLPLLLIVLIRINKSLSTIPWVFLAIVVLCFAFRAADPTDKTQFHLRIDNLFTGVFLRYMVDFRPKWFQLVARFSLIPAMLFWLPAVLLTMTTSGLAHSLLYTGIDIGCGCLVALCYAHDTMKFWSWAPLRLLASIGVFSYSIYLWQQPIAAMCAHRLGHLSAALLGFPLSILVGILMFYLIEQPAIRVRDKLTSNRSQIA